MYVIFVLILLWSVPLTYIANIDIQEKGCIYVLYIQRIFVDPFFIFHYSKAQQDIGSICLGFSN